MTKKLPKYLQNLEDEAVYILREAVVSAQNPVMMYSIGKDSTVMLELLKKAFYPVVPPVTLMHIDTLWKFREMISFRDRVFKEYGGKTIIHTNTRVSIHGEEITPFTHGKAYTDIMKTQALKEALNTHKFDVIIGGARRDEEKSRAKERIFSFRNKLHLWDPKNQRPELWNTFNAKMEQGESIRVFPISNWTEFDVWHYIYYKEIEIVPLYFAKKRPVVNRSGTWIMVDDSRLPIEKDEKIEEKVVRFRTLGCYPLSGAIESSAQSVKEIVEEIEASKFSERQGRLIDSDTAGSMEKKKVEGYF